MINVNVKKRFETMENTSEAGTASAESKFIKIRVIRAHAYNGATIAKEHKVDAIGLHLHELQTRTIISRRLSKIVTNQNFERRR